MYIPVSHPERACAYCGALFTPNRKDKLYCTATHQKAASGRRTGSFQRRRKAKNAKKQRPWIIHKEDRCVRCGFVPEHSCQLDVDHIDGNKENGDSSNLQTLCANCHRLKTYQNRDWET